MTRNQIEFAKLRETQRANLANEELTRLRDSRAHSVSLGQLQETGRHNQAVEALDTKRVSEQYRHNLATEILEQDSQRERRRANLAQEQLKTTELGLKAQEVDLRAESQEETHRHNVETEAAKSVDQALDAARIQETQRHNVQQEAIGRADVGVRSQQVGVQSAQLTESQRHNLVGEAQTAQQIALRQQEADTKQYSAETGRYGPAAGLISSGLSIDVPLSPLGYALEQWGKAGSAAVAGLSDAQRALSKDFKLLGTASGLVKDAGATIINMFGKGD